METQTGKKILFHLYTALMSGMIACMPLEILATTTEMDWKQPALKQPKNNEMNPDRVKLGKALFFDPRLSGSNWISCATCHNPALGWSDGLPTAIGHNMTVLGRATPTILNTAFNRKQMWDGRFRSLEQQALGPIQADVEMNQDIDELLIELTNIPGYITMFDKAYPEEGITQETIAKAIAAFERTVVSNNAPFDRFINGDKKAISKSAKRGFEIFKGKANCAACHQGHNFVDDGFHNIGLPDTDDPGRHNIVKVAILEGAFKTPTLRDVEMTAPYMHNGAYDSLEEVVEHYNNGGKVPDNLDPNMKPLHLTDQEKTDLVAFLKTLTGEPMAITVPTLPPSSTKEKGHVLAK